MRLNGLLMLGLAYLALSATVYGAIDVYLKIPEIPGESMAKGHEDEIDVLSLSWGITQPTSTHIGSGTTASNVHFGDLSITKYVDRASPLLFLNCCRGTHLPEAVFTFQKMGEVPYDILRITLEKVIISGVEIVGDVGDTEIQEQVTFNFAKIRFEYFILSPDGKPQPAGEMTWDVTLNKEI